MYIIYYYIARQRVHCTCYTCMYIWYYYYVFCFSEGFIILEFVIFQFLWVPGDGKKPSNVSRGTHTHRLLLRASLARFCRRHDYFSPARSRARVRSLRDRTYLCDLVFPLSSRSSSSYFAQVTKYFFPTCV